MDRRRPAARRQRRAATRGGRPDIFARDRVRRDGRDRDDIRHRRRHCRSRAVDADDPDPRFREPLRRRHIDGGERRPLRAIESGEPRDAARNGTATFCGFILAGILPLLAYILPDIGLPRFAFAALLAMAALFGIGAARAYFTDRTALRAGLEMLLLGAGAGAIAYGVGRFGAHLTGGTG